MADYMITHTSGREAYFTGKNDYFWNYYKPLMYICSGRDFNLLRGEKIGEVPAGTTLFALAQNFGQISDGEINGHKIIDQKNFGQLSIYKLEN